MSEQTLIIAIPKGRIARELVPLLTKVGITPEPAFFDERSRLLRFKTNRPNLELIRVRSFDVATFVAFGAAQLGIAGKDVLLEFDHSELYAPLDLQIGKCRLAVAEQASLPPEEKFSRWSHVRVATKYPEVTRKYFANRGIQAECIKLNGSMELAPTLGLCRHIVDLVSTGTTLRENGLREVENIADISSYLIVNRTAFKTRMPEINTIIEQFRSVVDGEIAAE